MDDIPRCKHTTKTGVPCRAPALPGRDSCLFHSESHASVRATARRLGGSRSHLKPATLPLDTPDSPLTNAQEIGDFIASTANAVRRGEVDAKVGNAVAALCNHLLKARTADLERRVLDLEKRLSLRVG